jgi:hypothetical protein
MNKENSIMKTIRSTPVLWACAALALIGGAVSMSVSANTISMDDYNGAGNTVSCDGTDDNDACFGFVGSLPLGPISLDDANADKFDQNGSSDEAAELALLNSLLILFDPERATVGDANKTDGDGDGFETNSQYFSIKKATELWFFENTSGGTVTVNLEGSTENYSHWTEYGPPVSEVPVPAAFWLFGTALVGFIGMSRRIKVS